MIIMYVLSKNLEKAFKITLEKNVPVKYATVKNFMVLLN